MEDELKDLKHIQAFLVNLKDALMDEHYIKASIIAGSLGQHIVMLMNLKKQGINYHQCENKEDNEKAGYLRKNIIETRQETR